MMMLRTLALMIAPLLLAAPPAAAQDQVNLTVDWVLNGTHAGYFLAQERGYYKDAGIDVTISRGFGSGDTIKRVATGSAKFGVADMGALIAALANNDIPVRAVAMIYDRASLGIIYLKESGIKEPKDLMGRTLARSASGASVNMLPGFLKANNVDRAKIREIVVDGATYLPLLMSRQADAVTEQAINIGKFAREAQKHGKEVVAMRFSDYGLESYGNALMVRTDTLKNSPDLIKRFTAASLRGIAAALENPEEAIKALRKNNPEIGIEGAMDELVALKEIQSTNDVKTHGLGYINRARMEATRGTVTDALALKKVVPLEEIYAEGFLPSPPINFKR